MGNLGCIVVLVRLIKVHIKVQLLGLLHRGSQHNIVHSIHVCNTRRPTWWWWDFEYYSTQAVAG